MSTPGQVAGRPIRVALARLPRMAAAFIRDALEKAGMELVEVESEAASGLDVDVLIVHRESTELTDAYARLVKANPGVRILTLTAMPQHEVFEFRFFGSNVRGQDVAAAVQEAMRNPLPRTLRAGN